MVKIRYSELPAGLHVSAERRGRHTIVYLLPGLTAAQRRAALIRVRSSARMGHGPRLPAVRMAVALGSDRLRTTVRNGAAAMRGHPLLLLPPLILLVSGGIVFLLMSFVTLTVRQHDRAQPPAPAAVRVASPRGHSLAPDPDPSRADPAGVTGPVGQGAGGSHHHKPAASPAPSSSSPGSTVPILSSSPASSPTSSPSPSPDPSPSPSASQSQTCLKIGPLGLCVGL
jgi:hypothetical protein